MSVLVRFSPPSLTREQYDAAVALQYERGVFPSPGLDIEVCFGAGDQMKVSILYDSMEAFQRHGEGLMPILQELGMNPGEPEVLEVHNVIHRGE